MSETARAPGLEVLGLTKRFGDFTALEDVSFKVEPGSFHALLGENGAGKSTLVKCVIGYQPPTSGDVLYDGRGVSFENPREAHAVGIGMVYQHFTLVQNMSVAENLVLVRPRIPAVIDWAKEHSALDAFMRSMPFSVPLDAPVHKLSAGQRQKLEILKQLYLKRRLLFLDEPTSVLTPQEADEVLGLLHGMTRKKELTVLIITHKFREVTSFADAVTVLRRGKLVGSGKVSELGTEAMAAMMVGSEAPARAAARVQREADEDELVVDKLCADDDTGASAVVDVSLRVRRGEIVGIAGVSGNGQTELLEVLSGQRRKKSGTVVIGGKPYAATRRQMREREVHVLPEMPLDNACVRGMSVSENLVLRDFDVPPIRYAGAFVSFREVRKTALRLIEAFNVRTPSPVTPIRNLSGGNIQRAVLARELSRRTRTLIVANPCFGLDFAASAAIRARIVDARNKGAAVLLISEDLDELLELSDRLCVMFEGEIVYETPTADADTTVIGTHMAGHAA